jgi:hypothetical protein
MALYDRAADLAFHYFRVAPDGSETKLAVGEHTAAWARPAATRQPDLQQWPSEILEALFERKEERRHLAS